MFTFLFKSDRRNKLVQTEIMTSEVPASSHTFDMRNNNQTKNGIDTIEKTMSPSIGLSLVCQICNEQYETKEILNRHTLTHSAAIRQMLDALCIPANLLGNYINAKTGDSTKVDDVLAETTADSGTKKIPIIENLSKSDKVYDIQKTVSEVEIQSSSWSNKAFNNDRDETVDQPKRKQALTEIHRDNYFEPTNVLIEQKSDSNINAFDDSNDSGDLEMPVEYDKDNKSDSDKTVHNAVGANIVNTYSTTKHMFREVKRRQECHVTPRNKCQNNCTEIENDSGRGDDLIQNWILKSDHLKILNEPDRILVSETNSMTKVDSAVETSDVKATNSSQPNMILSTTDNDGQDINQLEHKTGTCEQLKEVNTFSRRSGTKDDGAIYNGGSMSSDFTALHCKYVKANNCKDVKANKEVIVESISNNTKLLINHHNDNYCSTCNSSFTRKSSLVRHNRKFHRGNNFETPSVLIEQKSKSTINAFDDSNDAGDVELPFENDKDNKSDSDETELNAVVANIVKNNNITKHMLREVKRRQACHVTPTKKCQNSCAETGIDYERGDDLIQNWIHKSDHLKILDEPDRISVSETNSMTKIDSVFETSDVKATNSPKPNMILSTTDNDGQDVNQLEHKSGTCEQLKGVNTTSRRSGTKDGGAIYNGGSVSSDLTALHCKYVKVNNCKDVKADKEVNVESISNNIKLLINHHNDNYCSTCNSSFTRKSSLVRHNRKFHRDNNFETPNVLKEQNSTSTINAFDDSNDACDLEMPFENDRDNKRDSDKRVHNAVVANVVKTNNTTKLMLRQVKSRQECHVTPTKKCQNSCAETEIDSGRGDDLLQNWIHKSGHLKILNEADRFSVSETKSRKTKDSVFKTSDAKATNSPKPNINPTTTDNDGRYLHKIGTHEQPKGVSSTSRSAGNTDGCVSADLTALHCKDVNANKAAYVESVSNNTKLLINHHKDNYCSTCNSFYARKSSLVRHNRKFHSTKNVFKGSTSKLNDRFDTFSKVKKETIKSKYGEFDSEKSFRLIQKVRTNARGSDKNSNLSNADLYTSDETKNGTPKIKDEECEPERSVNVGCLNQINMNDSKDKQYLSNAGSYTSYQNKTMKIKNEESDAERSTNVDCLVQTNSNDSKDKSYLSNAGLNTSDQAKNRTMKIKDGECDAERRINLGRFYQRKTNFSNDIPYLSKGESFVSDPGIPNWKRRIYECTVCNSKIRTFSSFKAHLLIHTGVKQFRCDTCKYYFRRKSNLNRHMRMVHCKCHMCFEQFTRNTELAKHIREAHREKKKAELNCNVCSKQFTRKDILERHIMVHTREKPNQCEICGKFFSGIIDLKAHMKRHGDKLYACEICGKKISTLAVFKTHLLMHTGGGSDIICDICGARFRWATSLRQHKLTHTGLRDYKCDLCDRTLRTKWGLDIHIKGHLDIRMFQCSVCNKSFLTKRKMDVHMETHSTERSYQCELCNKILRSKSALGYHMFSHSGTKPFSCERCGQKFKRAANLRTHMLIHEGKKPHSCVTCGATFRQKTSLKLHMKKIHDIVHT